MADEGGVTVLLRAWAQGDEARSTTDPRHLRRAARLAAANMRRERAGHTLSPTGSGLRGVPQARRQRAPSLRGPGPVLRRGRPPHAAHPGRPRAPAYRDKRGGPDRPVTFDEEIISGDGPTSWSRSTTRWRRSPPSTSARRGWWRCHYFGGDGAQGNCRGALGPREHGGARFATRRGLAPSAPDGAGMKRMRVGRLHICPSVVVFASGPRSPLTRG